MEKVPTMITNKDLSYIEDMLNWNFNTIKKINHYINEIEDEDIIDLLNKVAKTYKKNYCILLDLLGGNYED